MDHARALGCLLAAASVACTVQSDNNAFGSASSTVGTSYTTTVSSGEDSTSSGSSTSGSESSETSSSTGSADTTSGSTTGVTSIDPSTSSEGGLDTGGGQPMDGMYSPCLEGADCGAQPALCIQSVDAMMNPIDGFCSETGCTTPAMDCDPSPGGTAVPKCVPITVNGMMQNACALDCSNMMTCPMGMQCMNFTNLGMICM